MVTFFTEGTPRVSGIGAGVVFEWKEGGGRNQGRELGGREGYR